MPSEAELMTHRVCFTGHRPSKLHVTEAQATLMLKEEIENAIADGYVTFISGMSTGVDIWAAEEVLRQKIIHPEIHLVCASPYEGFEQIWSANWQIRYNKLLNEAESVVYISKHGYTSFCYMERNKWMVNRSARVIAVYSGAAGGTYNTINYARSLGREIIIREG